MTITPLQLAARRPREAQPTSPHVRALRDVLLAVMPVLFTGVLMWSVLHGPFSALDFRYAYWSAGHRVLMNTNPYAWTFAQFHRGVAFVYPALSALVFTPLALFRREVGAIGLTLVGGCVAPVSLRLLNVRDWRVYAVTLVWLPVCAGWLTANESLFMVAGLAALWRWRDRAGVAGLLTAGMICLKPLLWPVVLWLLVTRRWRALAFTLAWGLVLNGVAWSVVGAGRIGAYLAAAKADATAQWRLGFGLPALLGHIGVQRTMGLVAMSVLTVALIVWIGRSAWAVRGAPVRDVEVQALALTVVLAIVSSPLLWSHYLALLIVPLALRRPHLHWSWLLPVSMWVAPPDVHPHLWQVLLFWVAGGILVAVTLLPPEGAPATMARQRLSLIGASR